MPSVNLKIFAVTLAVLCAFSCASDEEKKQSHYQKGIRYFEKGDFKSARIELKNAVQIDPRFKPGLLKLAAAEQQLGNLEEAFGTYERLGEIDPADTEVQLKLADFLALAGEVEEARRKVDLLRSKDPDNSDVLFLLAGLQLQAGDLSDAAATFEHIIASDSRHMGAHLGLARVHAARSHPEKAAEVLTRAVAIAPSDAHPRLALFNLYAAQEDFDRAEAEIREAVQLNPDDADLYLVLGNFHSARKNTAKAEEAYQRAVDIDPRNPKPYLRLAEFYNAAGDDDKALSVCRKAFDTQPDEAMVLQALARQLLRMDKVSEAEKYVGDLLKKHPGYGPSRLLRAELLVAQKQYHEAGVLLDRLITEESDSARVYYFMGLAQLGQGYTGVARGALAKAIELNPHYLSARLLLAEIHFRERHFEPARKQCREVLTHIPDNPAALLLLGTIDMYQRKYAAAQQAFAAAIDAAPGNPDGYCRLGLLYQEQQRFEPALAQYEKALSINPRLTEALTGMVRIYARQGEAAKALALCAQVLADHGSDPELAAIIFTLKGDLFRDRRDTHAAEAAYNRAIEKNPNFLAPYYALGRLQLDDSRAGEAIDRYRAILAQDPRQTGSRMLLGMIYEMQGEHELAEKDYREILRIKPDFAPAANNLAYILATRAHDLDEALVLARKAKEILPFDPNVMDTLGWIYYKKGLYDNAILELRESLERLPDNAVVHYHLAMALHAKGVNEEARSLLEKALGLADVFDGAAEARNTLLKL